MTKDKRPELDAQIEKLEETLQDPDSGLHWLQSRRFIAYIDAWSDLGMYYSGKKASSDIQLSAFVVASYVRVTSRLNDILKKDELEAHHSAAEQCLDALEYKMDVITTIAYTLRHGEEDREEDEFYL